MHFLPLWPSLATFFLPFSPSLLFRGLPIGVSGPRQLLPAETFFPAAFRAALEVDAAE